MLLLVHSPSFYVFLPQTWLNLVKMFGISVFGGFRIRNVELRMLNLELGMGRTWNVVRFGLPELGMLN